jgi:hypothetical protein
MIREDKRRKISGAGERARKLDRLSMRCFSFGVKSISNPAEKDPLPVAAVG